MSINKIATLITLWITLFSTSACSQTKNSNKKIDLTSYNKKIWISNSYDGEIYRYPSFNISNIDNNHIQGAITSNEIFRPYFDFYNYKNENNKGKFYGEIIDNKASFDFVDAYDKKGHLTLSFEKENEIKVSIKYYDEVGDFYGKVIDGNYTFIPYNLKHEYLKIYNSNFKEKKHIDIYLNSWGKIRILAGEEKLRDRFFPVLYIVDKSNNILYWFDAPFHTGSKLKDVQAKDVNNDNLIDVLVTTEFEDEDDIPLIHWTFIQNENGTFYALRENQE